MTKKINDNGVDRTMTKDEESAYLVAAEQIKADEQELADAIAAKAAARQAVLDKLGLTADEAATLFG